MSKSEVRKPVLLSRSYSYVRGLQLEGRYPKDVGLWPTTGMRIGVGWGAVPDSVWPSRKYDEWPPNEPPNVDAIAKRRRIGYYERVRTSRDVEIALGLSMTPVQVGVHITREWLRGDTDGDISEPTPDDEIVGKHAVLILGYANRRFKFANSWGSRWGNAGIGSMPYSYFERYLIEAHAPQVVPPLPTMMRNVLKSKSPLLNVCHAIYIYDRKTDDVEGWAFVFERNDGHLDLEELFVRPKYRRRGNGALLVREVLKQETEVGVPLRAWIPHADVERANLGGVRAVMNGLRLAFEPSPVPWARYVAMRERLPAVLRPW